MKWILFIAMLLFSLAGSAQPISTMPINSGASLDSVYVPTIRRSGNNWLNERVVAPRLALATKEYNTPFTGTSSGQFTLPKQPVPGTIEVFVSGLKIPVSTYTLNVNTVAVNQALLGYTLNTNFSVEIKYKSLF